MAAKNLSVEEMLGVSAAWIDATRLRPTLESVPLLLALLPEIERAHAAVSEVVNTSGEVPMARALSLVYERGDEADALHDRKARGVFKILDGLVDLADDPDQGVALEALRRFLFPTDDISVSRASWKTEAENGDRLRALLAHRPDRVAGLREIPLPPRGCLYFEVMQWLDAGAELGAIEDERATLERAAMETVARDAEARGDGSSARRAWIAVADALVSNTLVASMEDVTRRRLLGGYRDVEARADARCLQRRSRRITVQS